MRSLETTLASAFVTFGKEWDRKTAYAAAAGRTVAAIIAATPIRQDQEGRYCLNDLHRAAGGEQRHGPDRFMRLESTAELVAEIANSPDVANNPVQMSRGRYGGTYVVDDLALTYAMWVSPKFHLTVVRAFKETRKTHETDVGDAIMPAGTPQPIRPCGPAGGLAGNLGGDTSWHLLDLSGTNITLDIGGRSLPAPVGPK